MIPRTWHSVISGTHPVAEELLGYDWAKGMAGEGLWSGIAPLFPAFSWQTGYLAESWERPDPDTLLFHIRKGVYYHDKPPVNGREYTAHDAEFYIRRYWSKPGAYGLMNYPYLADMENVENSIYATDKWTLVIECQPGKAGLIFEIAVDFVSSVPPEVVEQYGNMNDWENVVGTGPFILEDYIPATSITFVRNPNYWMKDPLHPENQLPYLDGAKYLIIEDLSTRLAALRTGKIDQLSSLPWEDWESMMKTNPELLWASGLPSNALAIQPRSDVKPFGDIRVRQALSMAINYQAIVDDYYGGAAEAFVFPIMPFPENAEVYTPLEELPEESRMLYEYNPDRARQLLAEAGYPDGFKTNVVTPSIPSFVDLLSIVKAYWEDIGVELELDVKEYAAWRSINWNKQHTQMAIEYTSTGPYLKLVDIRPGTRQNHAMVDAPWTKEIFERAGELYFEQEERNKFVKENWPRIVPNAWLFQFPAPYIYTIWQPWLKTYHGENYVGYYNWGMFIRYIWLDQDLKEEMTGRR